MRNAGGVRNIVRLFQVGHFGSFCNTKSTEAFFGVVSGRRRILWPLIDIAPGCGASATARWWLFRAQGRRITETAAGAWIIVHKSQLPGTFFGPPNLVEMVRHRAQHQPDDIAFTFLVDGETDEVHLTNRELDRQARAIAAWLQAQGMVGQRALLLYPAGLEFIAAFFGCLYAGVVAVPVYPPRRNRSMIRIQAIADDAQAAVALSTDDVLSRVEAIIDETPHLKGLTWLATNRLPDSLEQRWSMPEIRGDTVAFLQYTSGSTGTPKGVVLNHFNLLHNSALIAYAFEHTRSGRGVFWLPSYHDMGLIGGILQPLYVGRPNILMSPMAFLQQPFRWLSAISRFRGTTSGGPNFAYDLCVRKISDEERNQLDLSSWKVAFNGAETVRPETLERFAAAFAPCGFRPQAFYPCFGLAEATLIVSGGYAEQPPVTGWFDAADLSLGKVTGRSAGSPGSRALAGCGGTLPDQQIVIANPDSMTRCAPGEVGEIWTAGPSVAQGYWGRPEATDAAFRAYLQDTGEGPFLRTGDLGFLQNGELFVTGRIKDLIILRGVNIYPQDIERTVQQCDPRLRFDSGAAFTVEADGREQLVIVQEFERRGQYDLPAVFESIRQAISAEHELPVLTIALLKSGTIPKTSSGKIQRHACRAGFLDGSLAVFDQWSAGAAENTPRRLPSRPAPAEPVPSTGGTPLVADLVTGPPTASVVAGLRTEPPTASEGRQPRGDRRSSISAGSGDPRRSGAGDSQRSGLPTSADIANVVLEEIRRIAKDRASGLTLDSRIDQIGLDSLERIEILAAIEQRLGRRFPEELLPELETCRQVVQAAEEYLKGASSPAPVPASGVVPAEHYRIEEFPEYQKLRENLETLPAQGLANPFFTVHQGIAADCTTIGGRTLINFSSYNYVGASGDPRVIGAVQEAVARYGTSVSASRLASGERPLHAELEGALARFLGTEAALTFVGGHATNETVIGHLLGPHDLVFHDELSHNSILQGARLSGAHRRAFPHNDYEAADRLLREHRQAYRRVLIVLEGVYSMDGDIPDLPRFIELKKRHKTLLMVDEAHSLGVLGARGRGIGEHFEVDRRDLDVWMGTLSKSLGSCGGYIAGGRALVEYLKYTAPGFVYSVGLPPGNAAAALASLRLLEEQPERVGRLRERARQFLERARRHGLDTGMSKDSPVVPVILGNSLRAVRLSRALFERGINVQPILYPAVKESAARLRFFLTALHTEEQIEYTIRALVEELGGPPPGAVSAVAAGAIPSMLPLVQA
jgi:8-amino-7-oxononanoate synthase